MTHTPHKVGERKTTVLHVAVSYSQYSMHSILVVCNQTENPSHSHQLLLRGVSISVSALMSLITADPAWIMLDLIGHISTIVAGGFLALC